MKLNAYLLSSANDRLYPRFKSVLADLRIEVTQGR